MFAVDFHLICPDHFFFFLFGFQYASCMAHVSSQYLGDWFVEDVVKERPWRPNDPSVN